MRSLPDRSNLPSNYQALRFVCSCFGIGEKELTQTLHRMRNADKNPDKYFPRELSRMMLTRAETKQGKWHHGLITLHLVALRERLLRENGELLFSIAGTVADIVVCGDLEREIEK